MYQSALAHIVAGFRECRPILIVDADEMLAQLEEAALVAAEEAQYQAGACIRSLFTSTLAVSDSQKHTTHPKHPLIHP